MKIGIISINMYSRALNFACPLHTWAFQQFLLSHGIESTVIDYTPIYFDNFDLRHPYNYYEEKCRIYSGKKAANAEDQEAIDRKLEKYTEKRDAWNLLIQERERRYDKFQQFIEKNYKKTELCYNADLLEALDPGFDCYICVTDVIWKNQPGYGFDPGFFLGCSCMDQKWKFAYSASQGSYMAETDKEKEQFFRYLSDFDRISVREKSLQQYLEEHMDREIGHVLDPVLLNPPELYEKTAVKPKEERYLFLYYVTEQADDTVREAVAYARRYHYRIIETTDFSLKNGKVCEYSGVDCDFHYDIGIEEWLGYIRYADVIFTNSFHACCLSILFRKNFYAGFRRNDKIRSLLGMFGLTDRLIAQKEDSSVLSRAKNKLFRHAGHCLPHASLPDNPIDYSSVGENLQRRTEESAEWILSALRMAETGVREIRDYDSAKKAQTYKLLYNSHYRNKPFTWTFDEHSGKVRHLATGSYEYTPDGRVVNDGTARLLKNGFVLEGYRFTGWRLRIRIGKCWFWCCAAEGKTCLVPRDSYDRKKNAPYRIFREEELLPFFPVNRIQTVVAEACWEPAL